MSSSEEETSSDDDSHDFFGPSGSTPAAAQTEPKEAGGNGRQGPAKHQRDRDRRAQERFEREWMHKAPEEIKAHARKRGFEEVKKLLSSAESLKDINTTLRMKEQMLFHAKEARTKQLREQVGKIRSAMASLGHSKDNITILSNKFDTLTSAEARPAQQPLRHIEHIKRVNAAYRCLTNIRDYVVSIKTVEDKAAEVMLVIKKPGLLLQNWKEISKLTRIREKCMYQALTNPQATEKEFNFLQTAFRKLDGLVDAFENEIWYYMANPIVTAKKTPHILVTVNIIVEAEEDQDILRREMNEECADILEALKEDGKEQDPPCKIKAYDETRDRMLEKFQEKRFKELTLKADVKDVAEEDLADEERMQILNWGKVAEHLVGSRQTIELMHTLLDDLNGLRESVVACFPSEIRPGASDSEAQQLEAKFFKAYHNKIYEFLRELSQEEDMLPHAPNSMVQYIDFIEDYYWRMDEQLYMKNEDDWHEWIRNPNIRKSVGWSLKTFYLNGMSINFEMLASNIIDSDFTKALEFEPTDGKLTSNAPQDIFNIIWQHISTIDNMKDEEFLFSGYKELGKCLECFNRKVAAKLDCCVEDPDDPDGEANWCYAVVVLNNSEAFEMLSDEFTEKCFEAVDPRFHDQMCDNDAEGDLDDIVTKFQDTELVAVKKLAQALLKQPVKIMKSLLFKEKWYGKKKSKEPMVVQMFDYLNEAFKKLQHCLSGWYFNLAVQTVLERLLMLYIGEMLYNKNFDIHERTKDDKIWNRTHMLEEDMELVKDFFGHWMRDSDIDERRCEILEAIVTIINSTTSETGQKAINAAIETIVKQTPDFSECHLDNFLDKRKDMESMKAQFDKHLEQTRMSIPSECLQQPWAPWRVIGEERQAEEAAGATGDEEVDEKTAKKNRLAKKRADDILKGRKDEEKQKRQNIRRAFEAAAASLGDAANQDMDLADFLES